MVSYRLWPQILNAQEGSILNSFSKYRIFCSRFETISIPLSTTSIWCTVHPYEIVIPQFETFKKSFFTLKGPSFQIINFETPNFQIPITLNFDSNGFVIRNSWLRTWPDIVHFSGSNNGQSRSDKVQNKVDSHQADHIGLNNVWPDYDPSDLKFWTIPRQVHA